MEDAILKTTGLCKTFGKTEVLKDIDYTLRRGEVYGLIGQNGAGKTTLLRLIAGLMKPTGGQIALNTQKRFIGYMPQSCRFDENSTAVHVLGFYASLRNAEVQESIALCKRLNFDCTKRVKHLSPGQQKKLLMLIAMAGDPDLYILDEPTAGLDPAATDEMSQLITMLHERGKSIIVSSHILQDMDTVCTDVAIMERGRLIYNRSVGSRYTVKTNPLSGEIVSAVQKQYHAVYHQEQSVLTVEAGREEIAGVIRLLTTLSADIYEVTRSDVKTIAREHMSRKEAVLS